MLQTSCKGKEGEILSMSKPSADYTTVGDEVQMACQLGSFFQNNNQCF